MKKVIIRLLSLSVFLIATMQLSAQSKDIKKSRVIWKGYKVTGSHEGTVNLKSGNLVFKDDVLSGGGFVLDISSLTSTDLEGDYKNKLEGHLKSDDFFGVAKYPTASLKINNAKKVGKNAYIVGGTLTIKGVTKNITFPAAVYGNKASASIKIDRTEYGVKYGSTSFFEDLKDKAIYDEFDLTVDLDF